MVSNVKTDGVLPEDVEVVCVTVVDDELEPEIESEEATELVVAPVSAVEDVVWDPEVVEDADGPFRRSATYPPTIMIIITTTTIPIVLVLLSPFLILFFEPNIRRGLRQRKCD